MLTSEGLTWLLDNDLASTALYVGLIDGSGTVTLALADTMASHAGWAENQSYAEATRVTWGQGAAAGQLTTNAAALTFTFNAAATIHGIFLVTVATKGDATGTLIGTFPFSTPVAKQAGEVLRLTLTGKAAEAA